LTPTISLQASQLGLKPLFGLFRSEEQRLHVFGGPIHPRGKVEKRIRQTGRSEANESFPQLFVVDIIHGVIIPTMYLADLLKIV